MRWFTVLFLLAACNGDEDKSGPGEVDDTGPGPLDDTSEPPDDSEPPACAAAVLSTDPLDGAVDVAIDAVPTVVISEADPTALLESDIAGSFTVSPDGTTLTWVADAALDYETTYTVTATTCTGSQSFSFTTIQNETPDHLVGRTWSFNLSDGTITDPAALESLIGDSLVPGLLGASAAGPGTVDLRVAATDTDDTSSTHQQYCLATSDVDGATYDDGGVHGQADEVWVSLVEGDPVPVYHLDFSGLWNEDGSSFTNGSLQGQLDARYVSEWVAMDPDELCSFAPLLGTSCEECPDGEEYCVFMHVEDLSGDEVPTTVIEILGNDCEGCDVGEPVCE